jgi:hypothetical protein
MSLQTLLGKKLSSFENAVVHVVSWEKFLLNFYCRPLTLVVIRWILAVVISVIA